MNNSILNRTSINFTVNEKPVPIVSNNFKTIKPLNLSSGVAGFSPPTDLDGISTPLIRSKRYTNIEGALRDMGSADQLYRVKPSEYQTLNIKARRLDAIDKKARTKINLSLTNFDKEAQE